MEESEMSDWTHNTGSGVGQQVVRRDVSPAPKVQEVARHKDTLQLLQELNAYDGGSGRNKRKWAKGIVSGDQVGFDIDGQPKTVPIFSRPEAGPWQPRNYGLLLHLEIKFPGFSWRVKEWQIEVDEREKPDGVAPSAKGKKRGKKTLVPAKTGKRITVTRRSLVFTNYPIVRGSHGHVTLAELWLMPENLAHVFREQIKKGLQPIIDVGDSGVALAETLTDLGISTPPREVAKAVAEWLTRARSGESTTVFSGVCPDYATDDSGRYTFSDLRAGVGVVAKRVLKAIPRLDATLKLHGVSAKFVVAIGDFEAGAATCSRLGITVQEFQRRLRESQQAFRAACPASVNLETPFATEVGGWYATLAAAQKATAEGRFSGKLTLTEADILRICEARASLYRRWHGDGVDVMNVLRSQIPEYLAMATIAFENFGNALILGGDAPVMAPFMQGLSDVVRPVVYLKKVDY